MYEEMGLALYCFNVKKHRGLYLDVSSGPKKSVTFQSYTFLNVNDVADMTCRRFMFRYKVLDRHFAHLWSRAL
jgi:hypothetical protein